MKIVSFPLSILFLLCLASGAQGQANLDSLYTKWQDDRQPDSTRVDALKSYIWDGFLYSNTDSALTLAEQMVAFSKAVKYPIGEATGLRILGIIKRIEGDYDKAIDYYKQSMAVAERQGALKEISLALNNIGNVYYHQDNHPAALDYFRRSLRINEEIGLPSEIALATNNIGFVLIDQGKMAEALEYFQRSLKIREQLNDQNGIAASLSPIGTVYSQLGDYPMALSYFQKSLKIHTETNDQSAISTDLIDLGNLYFRQQDYVTAEAYYQRSLKIAEALGNQMTIANIMSNLGHCFANQDNYAKALLYFQRSLKINEALDAKGGISSSLSSIGEMHRVKGSYSKAIEYCKKGLEIAEQAGILGVQDEACTCLYATYKAMGKGNEALIFLEKLNGIKDSLNAEATTKKLQQMEFAKQVLKDSIDHAEEKRVVEAAHQETMRKESRTKNILAVSGFILLLLSGGFFSRWRFVKRSRAVLQVEKDRSENLLLNILPVEIADELKKYGRSEARHFDMVSILVTDFKGFTEISARLSPAELVSEINHCFEAFDGIMEKYGVEKIKTIGDAYMAAGGLPVPSGDAVKNTVRAALEMQSFIIKRKSGNELLQKSAFQMRAGIHTGPVVAGIVGVKKFQYDIWGDTVNTASRMESHGETGRVNISKVTYDLIKDDPDFVCQSRGMVTAKGKGEMEMFFVNIK